MLRESGRRSRSEEQMVVLRCLGRMVDDGSRGLSLRGRGGALRYRMRNGQRLSGETRSWWAVTAYSQGRWYLRYPLFRRFSERQPDETCKLCSETAQSAEVGGRRTLLSQRNTLRRRRRCRQIWNEETYS